MEGHLGLVPAVDRTTSCVRKEVLVKHRADIKQIKALLHEFVLAPVPPSGQHPLAALLSPEEGLEGLARADVDEAVGPVALREGEAGALGRHMGLQVAAESVWKEHGVRRDLHGPVVDPEVPIGLDEPPELRRRAGRIERRHHLGGVLRAHPVAQRQRGLVAEDRELVAAEDPCAPGDLVLQHLGLETRARGDRQAKKGWPAPGRCRRRLSRSGGSGGAWAHRVLICGADGLPMCGARVAGVQRVCCHVEPGCRVATEHVAALRNGHQGYVFHTGVRKAHGGSCSFARELVVDGIHAGIRAGAVWEPGVDWYRLHHRQVVPEELDVAGLAGELDPAALARAGEHGALPLDAEHLRAGVLRLQHVHGALDGDLPVHGGLVELGGRGAGAPAHEVHVLARGGRPAGPGRGPRGREGQEPERH
mmetsp:Transcript_11998/g.35081  ORF Transcript_11998/g.35081 Transcript_11998/m.35081 type:complete len:420 (+) Transcript_11998:197-1456(+)